MAYLGMPPGRNFFLLLLLFVTFTDKNNKDDRSYPILARVYCVLLYVGEAALMATALYIAFTPLGLATINGCQGRYLIPMVYPLCAILTGRGIPIKKIPRWVYELVILLLIFVVLYYEVFVAMLGSTMA
jgi:uncharacterized membrane protein